MKLKKIILIVVFMAFSSTVFVVNVQAASDFYKKNTFVKPENQRKKAPKRKAQKFKKVEKADLKYVDKSESSKINLYNPKTKSKIDDKKEKEIVYKTAGGKRFKSMGCVMCHKLNSNRLGPSVAKLSKYYNGKQKVLIEYLKRKGKPIIEPERSSVMKTQLAKLSILSDEQHEEVSEYIISGGK